LAKETAAKAKALRLTSSEAPASIVSELPLSANLALPGNTGEGAGAEDDGEGSDGVPSQPEPVDTSADHPSLFPRRDGVQILPKPPLPSANTAAERRLVIFIANEAHEELFRIV
jgi:hypothetical protein